MRLREHSAVQSKSDMFQVDPRKLKVDGSYNVRDMSSKETRDHIAKLKASIMEAGVKTPLEVRLGVRDQVYVVAGHCRLEAVLQAIKEGAEIRAVPCIQEAKGTSEHDRTLNLILSNDGLPLAPLEKAKVVKRLTDWKWEPKDIAAKLGWKSAVSVRHHLEMLELSEPVKERIRAGDVSATTARHLAKSDLTPEEQEELLRANKEQNERIKGPRKRSTKVTPRTIKRDAPKPAAPEAKSDPVDVTSEVGIASSREYALNSRAADYAERVAPVPAQETQQATEGQTDAPIDLRHEETSSQVPVSVVNLTETHDAIHGSLRQIKEILDAFKPFADCAALLDFSVPRSSEFELIEVRVTDLQRALEVYTKATGGDDLRDAA